jgi:hypothetical protein
VLPPLAAGTHGTTNLTSPTEWTYRYLAAALELARTGTKLTERLPSVSTELATRPPHPNPPPPKSAPGPTEPGSPFRTAAGSAQRSGQPGTPATVTTRNHQRPRDQRRNRVVDQAVGGVRRLRAAMHSMGEVAGLGVAVRAPLVGTTNPRLIATMIAYVGLIWWRRGTSRPDRMECSALTPAPCRPLTSSRRRTVGAVKEDIPTQGSIDPRSHARAAAYVADPPDADS